MVKNRSHNPKCKTSLVLAPQALLDQWKMEIELKTNDGLKCLIYHGEKPSTIHGVTVPLRIYAHDMSTSSRGLTY